ncbi:MAG: dynamin family protein [Lachnospiraceae bacterium]|nr:dynamin family protein [Lachnospiraceae bacterium]
MEPLEHVRQGLQLVRRIADSSVLSEKATKTIEASYDQVLQRMNLPYLNLSIIGEFSAGKSTLINGILGLSLLKTDLLACTAVPTYLYCSGQPVLTIEVHMLNGKSFELHGLMENPLLLEKEEVFALLKYLEYHYGYSGDPDHGFETKNLIAVLTSDGLVAQYLKKVLVMVPDYALGEETRLIDTPGIDAAGEMGERHTIVTQNVLQSEADALLLVLDPKKIYGPTLENFLRANAEGFMSHSLIIINKADLIPEDERDEILEYVQALLLTRFEVEVPVYMVSASEFSDGGLWQEEFQTMLSDLREYMKRSHDALMNEMLLAGMNEVMEKTRATVLKRRDEMICQKKMLEENKPERLENIAKDLAQKLDRTINEKCYTKDLSYQWYTAAANCKKLVASDLSEAKTRSDIKSYAAGTRMEERVNAAFAFLENELTKKMQEISDAFSELYASANQKMQECCHAIVEHAPEDEKTRELQTSLKENAEDLMRRIYVRMGMNNSENGGFFGRIGKNVSDYFYSGPIRWAAGSFLEMTANRHKTDEARTEVMDALSKSLAEQEWWIMAECTSHLVEYARKRKDTCLAAFYSAMDHYRELYDNVFKQYTVLWEKHEREIKRLEDFLAEMEDWEAQCAGNA